MRQFEVPAYAAVSDTGFIFLGNSGETFNLNEIGKEIFDLIRLKRNTEEVFKAKDIIKKQNLSINQITMDKEYYENKVKLKEQELKEYTKLKKNSIMSDLLNDSSTENQLKLVTKILGDFSNEGN